MTTQKGGENIKYFSFYKRIFLILILLTACHPLRGCIESELRLSPESRLPKWFVIPNEFRRDDISVTFTYYTSMKVKVIFWGPGNKKLSEFIGTHKWHPSTEKKGFLVFPMYSYIKVENIEELIEQRSEEDILYIVDDLANIN